MVSCRETADWLRWRLGCGLRWAQGTMYLVGAWIPWWKGQFWRLFPYWKCTVTTKTAKLIKMPFELWTVHRAICWTMSSQSALSCQGSAFGLLNRTHLCSHVTDWPHTAVEHFLLRSYSVEQSSCRIQRPDNQRCLLPTHLKTVLFAQQHRHHSV